MDERKSNLFRKQALNKISSPEQLDQLIKITLPRGWIALIGIFLLLIALLTWSIFGRVNTEVSAPCIILSAQGGISRVSSDRAGVVTKIFQKAGSTAQQGAPLVEIRLINTSESLIQYSTINAPITGLIDDNFAIVGEYVAPGTFVAAMQPIISESDPLIVHAFVSPEDGAWVKPGMTTLTAIDRSDPLQDGYLVGTIINKIPFPRSHDGLIHYLQNEYLVNMMSKYGPPYEIEVALKHNLDNPSKYLRTSNNTQKASPVLAGALCITNIVIDSRAPINFIFPKLRQ